jgi:cytochrome b561
MVYLIYAVLIFSCFFIFIFKDQVRKAYQNNTRTVMNVTQAFGIFIIGLSFFRITILAVGGYPNL